MNFDSLCTRIIFKIDQLQVARARGRILIARIVGGISFVALFPIFVNMVQQLQASGFLNYFSLLFTDGGAMATYWREFSLSLAESLPVFQLALIILSLLVLFVSIR